MEDKNSSNFDKNGLIEKIKNFHYFTHIGTALLIVFIIFCFIGNTAVRWWLMIPLPGVGIYLLYTRKDQADDLEKKICTYGIYVFIAVFILRDIAISHKLASIIDSFRDVARGFESLSK